MTQAVLVASAVVLSMVSIAALRPLGKWMGLVDHPDKHRKFHEATVPMTGGLAILVTLLVLLTSSGMAKPIASLSPNFWSVVAVCLVCLVILHAIDDVIELHYSTRFAIDIALALILCLLAAIRLTDLEDLFGFGTVWLGRFSIPMTIFCFVAASNAFNWVDGIDGLCAGLGIICFATVIGLIAMHTGDDTLTAPLTIVIAALVPLYLANTGVFGERFVVFLGDSGARLIGFIAAIALVVAGFKNMIQPVTAYFPIAVPVCDCLVLMGWRMAQGRSPLAGDRLHLHHLFLDAGFSHAQTRHWIFTLAIAFSLSGFAFEWSGVPAWVISAFVVVSFWAFIGLRLWLYSRRLEPDPAP